MKKNNLQFISDIKDAIDWILDDYVKGVSYIDFAENHEKVDAVIRQIAIIGEAMNGLENEFLTKYPELPSKDAVAMRNVLVHDYDMVDTEELWKTTTTDLPKLRKVVEKILEETPPLKGFSRKEDFSVPKEYRDLSDRIYAKKDKTKRDFVDLSVMAIKLVENHWDKRQGLAYHVVGMLANSLIQDDPLLDEIGCIFGTLELPDHHIADTEEGVREKWEEVKELVLKADKRY
jgi:uncharacterized protein with HEPN domain